MAEVLKLEYGLTALKVWIDTFGERPRVRFALQGKIEGRVQVLQEWEAAAPEMGLPERIDRSTAVGAGPAFRLPAAILEELGARREIEALRAYGEPLWLHLVKPYGYLGMVPWESLLVTPLGVPVLRLPDFIVPPPRETRRALEVALCSSAPLAKDSFPLVSGLVEMAGAILSSVERRVRIHMFIDVERHGELGRLL
ncbi:MAG TPA: hypothetical protein VFX50_06345, partial [Gemmatimonadales bacterium]|nr:hypothetical protein [Gemmatimonadales bacterium]